MVSPRTVNILHATSRVRSGVRHERSGDPDAFDGLALIARWDAGSGAPLRSFLPALRTRLVGRGGTFRHILLNEPTGTRAHAAWARRVSHKRRRRTNPIGEAVSRRF